MVPALDQLLGNDLHEDNSWSGITNPLATRSSRLPQIPGTLTAAGHDVGSVSTACHRGAGDSVLSLKLSSLFTQVWAFRWCALLQPHAGQPGDAN